MMEGNKANEQIKRNEDTFSSEERLMKRGPNVSGNEQEYERDSDEFRSENRNLTSIPENVMVNQESEDISGKDMKVLYEDTILQEEKMLHMDEDALKTHLSFEKEAADSKNGCKHDASKNENLNLNTEIKIERKKVNKNAVLRRTIYNPSIITKNNETSRLTEERKAIHQNTIIRPCLHEGFNKYEMQITVEHKENVLKQTCLDDQDQNTTIGDQEKIGLGKEKAIECKVIDTVLSEVDHKRKTNENKLLDQRLNVPQNQLKSNDAIIYERKPCRGTINEYVKQASLDNGSGLSKVLTILNMTDKYPGMLTREDMFQITRTSLFDEQPQSHWDLANYFLQNIAKYNYTAREMYIMRRKGQLSSTLQTEKKSKFRQILEKFEEHKEIDVSPTDVIIAIFLCCDDICRQDLLYHMWKCRLAIPLVIQKNPPPILPSCYLWPLRSLVMRWEAHSNETSTIRDGRLVKEPIQSIAFLRLGEINVSKSALINNVISVSEKTHSIFLHRNSPGFSRHRHLVDGLIDVGWYFPTPTTEGRRCDHFMDAVMFLNLHGDASKFQSQVYLLSKIANVITILCKVEDFHGCIDILKVYLNNGNSLLLIFTDKNIDTKDEYIINSALENLQADENKVDFMIIGDKTNAEFVRETRNRLRLLSKGKNVCLEDAFYSGIHITLDETTDDFIETKKDAREIINVLRKTPYKDRKRLHLPLQDDPWIRWTIADKELLRTANKKKNESLESYLSERMKIMNECRLTQLKILQTVDNNTLLTKFLKVISTANIRRRKLFLRCLKLELDDFSREQLLPVYERYQHIMKQLAADGKKNKELKTELEKLDQEVALRSFGLEHMLREMGQRYEAAVYGKSSNVDILPELAATILLDGYPFELLDGHVNSVPSLWVREVLNKVETLLRHKDNKDELRIKVISALGIQSSGKSTMLNAMFGCQYAVSAGRCTRGVYCQFIKAEETFRQDLGIDYVLAIDTEGLRAPELSASGQMVKHDNELSTFVIGLADVTILNLMGENNTYLDELLPISVHAFLRMEITTGSKPKCAIVHQNVNKEDDQKLLQQGRMLEVKLNKMTESACKIERTPIKSFKTVIQFDVTKDVFYLTALLEGIQPMAPISPRYSEELNAFKRTLLTKDGSRTSRPLSSFIKHLDRLWKAIKKDDFVYQFRNTIEAEARGKLDDYWCEAKWKFRQPIHETLSKGYEPIQNCANEREVEKLRKLLQTRIDQEIIEEYIKQKTAFKEFIKHSDTLMKEAMSNWSVDMDKRFDDLRADLERETSIKISNFEKNKKRELFLRKEKITYKDNIKSEIEQFVSDVKASKQKPLSETEISELFEKKWRKWKSRVLNENPRLQSHIDIENDAYNAISETFPSGRNALNKCLGKRSIESYDFENFEVKEIASCIDRIFNFIGVSKTCKDLIDFVDTLFEQVDRSLESRGGTIEPYRQEDIDGIVILAQKHFQSNRTDICLELRHEVYITVIICGHSIKKLRKFHEDYEVQINPEVFLENDKSHYLRIFKALYNEAETLRLVVADCQEIIKKGILEKLTRTFPSKMLANMRSASFTMTSKSLAILAIMVETATNGKYEEFDLFIRKPQKSISRYISKCVDNHMHLKSKILQDIYKATLHTIKEEVRWALEKSCKDAKDNFQIWLRSFHEGAKEVIVLENIDGLRELGKDTKIDMTVFFQNVKKGFDKTVCEIGYEMTPYLAKHFQSFKDEVVSEITKTIIGCTESCPFCGAICIVAHAGHHGDHYTTIHRPQGCKGWHDLETKILVTDTCPVLVATENVKFKHRMNGTEAYYYYKEYRKVFPNWKITSDETGEETSFWNWFFVEYMEQIAGEELELPEIPPSWKYFDRESEINKLKNQMKK